MGRILKLLLILIPGLPFSILLIKFKSISAPFVLILALWFILFLIAGLIETKQSIKVICFNISIIILIFGFFEFYFWKIAINQLTFHQPSESPYRIEGSKHDVVGDDILGYALRKNSTRRVKSYYKDNIIYNINYSTDKNGLRITPFPNKTDAPAILFFGDSFTYGAAVNDDETTPYITGILTGREYAIYNFGVHGHGPQYMLAEIDHGIVESVLTHKPQFAIYQAIPEHVYRLKGLQPWLMRGPHYTLNEKGEIIPSSISIPLWTRIKEKLPIFARIESHIVQKSFFYNTLNRRISRVIRSNNKQADTRENDIKTFVGVIDKSRNLLTDNYQGIELHVIFWDDNYCNDVINALEMKHIKVHKLSSILKDDFWNHDSTNPYRVPHDGHPSPLMHQIMARYVVNEIIGKKIE